MNVFSIDGKYYWKEGLYEVFDELYDEYKLSAGVTYYIGDAVFPKASEFFDINKFINMLTENADDYDELSYTYPEISPTKQDELDSLIKTWLDNNVTVYFYDVENVREVNVTQDDIDDYEENRGYNES